MTTHEEHATTARPEDMGESREPNPAAVVREADPGPDEAQTLNEDNTLLFADEHRSGLHSRWNDVQAAFVDNPKESVQKADNLVAEVVEELTVSFADTRSRLEAQWSRGEEASTEDLRVALTRYRDFFQRLLSV
ncbi:MULTISPECIES: hypothetical protein [Mycolicibacterium]|uniref:Uncharacterized protein n=1 Tax=Mycolicibacterium senegalense TaxID=1796 RepID=A0A378WDG6_9MYCO|nr:MULTISPECIES: hypothetical protein [Mycolicibacterium]MCV7336528.1 hypothetical protein [Mycolicibacterium senegalense]MDR7291412.1 hypothetical protein [Mycolicibacterium senegalense]QZA22899.1 hypothetical protein K3U95_19530 [Mycolicibacterium senegalense]CDP84133.1 hypothetical protein BN975_01363 [Mycolicibacterium farcinogenes]SUA32364.1 Uncharacterised protein [Mycolicibacterium senegalense]